MDKNKMDIYFESNWLDFNAKCCFYFSNYENLPQNKFN